LVTFGVKNRLKRFVKLVSSSQTSVSAFQNQSFTEPEAEIKNKSMIPGTRETTAIRELRARFYSSTTLGVSAFGGHDFNYAFLQ
jgi:hypothetical protein